MSKKKSLSRRAMLSSNVAVLPALPAAAELRDTDADGVERGRKLPAYVPAPTNFVPLSVKAHFGAHYHDAITQAMAILTEYLVPDTGKSAEDALSEVLGILDHRDLVRALRARPMNECVPEAGMLLHDKFNDTWDTLTAKQAADLRRDGERDAVDGIIDFDGIHYDGWLPAESKAA
jgi:hypothetical protein